MCCDVAPQVKACDPVTSSVANTAKRVIVMLYMAAVTGKALTHEQALGAGVAIAGVFLYSVVDDLSKKYLKNKRDERRSADCFVSFYTAMSRR
jgi:hypothetical protein